MKSIVIFGGGGFVGRHLVHRLAKKGFKIIIPYQRSINEGELRLLGNLGQIIPIKFNNLDDLRIKKILRNIDICINLKTIWKGKNSDYKQNIYEFNNKLINILKQNQFCGQFVFFSGLGIDEDNKSLRSKAIYESEKLISSLIKDSIIIRPAIIIGENDNFLAKLIPIIKLSYLIPLFGSGKSKLQLVFVDDISMIIEKIIITRLKGSHIFELFGTKELSYIELYNFIIKALNKKRILIPIPMFIAKIVIFLAEKTPFSPLTYEQLLLFEKDNLAKNIEKGFNFFNIMPQDCFNLIKKIAENK